MALGPPPLHTPLTSPLWKRYFERLSQQLGGTAEGGVGYFNGLDFTGSNITSILLVIIMIHKILKVEVVEKDII